ncbi:MAG: ribonuclease III [Ruminococcaceae bacterium]|nr:ribonuclease III [Oscillospiraceae bacterium]
MLYDTLSGLTLAYLGDAVLEVQTRKRLLSLGITDLKTLNKEALSYVRAVDQSAAVERILPHLSEDEEAIFKRGRNSHGVSAPKSATVAEYRRATGMEALFGWLYLKEEHARIEELFALAFPRS